MHRFFTSSLLGVLLATTACAPRNTQPPQTQPTLNTALERSFTLLSINDVYRIEGTDDGAAGGFPRLRQLRAELEEEAPDLLMLHAGDLLFPSLLSREFLGAQMIDVLNHLDGDGEAFDERLLITFGNHEFDKDKLRDAEMVNRRLAESDFTWLDGNIQWKTDTTGQPLVAADNLMSSKIVESGGVQVGIFGVSTDAKHPAYVERFRDPQEEARRLTAELRAAGAEVVVALTHLSLGEDVALMQKLGAEGPDLLLGGHEHNRLCRRIDLQGREEVCVAEPEQAVEADGASSRLILKADAEVRTALVVRVSLPSSGVPRVHAEYRSLHERFPEDAAVSSVVDAWLEQHDEQYCRENLEEPPGCLAKVLGKTQVRLVGEELSIRRYETNLGNWLVDQALEAHKDRGVVAAFINSGSLRLNQDIPPGDMTLRHVEEIFQYPSYLRVLEVRGAVLQEVIRHAVTDWTGNGHWLQIAGFAFRHDPTTDPATADRLTLLTADGPRPIAPDETLRIVTSDFLADPRTGQDGYTMLTRDMWVDEEIEPLNLKDLAMQALSAAGDEGIAPEVEGRICNTTTPGPCLATQD